MAPTTPQHEEVAAQLRDLERQGGGMARLAHICAGLLLVAFSLGSLISISHAAFVQFLAAWEAGQLDIPDGISLVVNILLIVACDVGLLYAGSVLRVLNASDAPKKEKRAHLWAMWGASILEGSTYLYLAWIFDRPTTLFLWLLMIARAVAAPLFASYLSMARPLPVGPGDVAYHASLASGKGVVRDVAQLAADPDAPLERKVRIYRASARMAPADRVRFDNIVEAVSMPDAPAIAAPAISMRADDEKPTRPPTGGGSPIAAPAVEPATTRTTRPAVLRLEAPIEQPRRRTAARAQTPQQKRRATLNGRRVRTGADATASYEQEAKDAWANGARTINKMMAATGMSRAAASKWVRTFKGGFNPTTSEQQFAQ